MGLCIEHIKAGKRGDVLVDKEFCQECLNEKKTESWIIDTILWSDKDISEFMILLSENNIKVKYYKNKRLISVGGLNERT